MYIWNSVNAILNAAQSPLILMVLTRTNGLNDSGVFSIAYAVATLLMFVGQYGLRRFQSSSKIWKSGSDTAKYPIRTSSFI